MGQDDAESAELPPPRPWWRRRKVLAWVSVGVAAVVVVAALGLYTVYSHLNANIHQADITGLLGRQPVDLHPQAENIVVIGSDTRDGQENSSIYGTGLTTDQSDTLMIVHIPANRQYAEIMSIPRDSWVNIPACQMGNGKMASPTTFKINEAYALGNLDGNHTALGAACTIKTLEQDTGIPIDHFVVVNFTGLIDMVNAVGGVPECNTVPIKDPLSGLRLTAGYHVLNGTQALGYVRARYTIGDGSDLQRIGRQQAFMSSLVDRVKSRLTDPLAIYHFLDAATKSLTIDSQLGGAHGLYDLAMSLKSLPSSKVLFFTLPTYPRSLVVPGDTANVLWTQPEDNKIFADFRDDVPVSTALVGPAIPPSQVTVRVRNGTTRTGLAARVSRTLRGAGFKVAGTGDAATDTVTQTVVEFHSGQQQAATLVQAKVPGAAIALVKGTGSALTVVLGTNYGTDSDVAAATPTPSPSGSVNVQGRTANQNICTSA